MEYDRRQRSRLGPLLGPGIRGLYRERVQLSDAVDGFQLAYDDHRGDGAGTVVLLHGWPGDRHDFRDVVPLLSGRCRVVVPDLRGFGDGDSVGTAGPVAYGGDGQARSVLGLVESLGVGPVVLAGYDVGSRVAQAAARTRPDLVRALVLSPPLPGAGDRVLTPAAQREFWYQAFHELPLAEQLLDGSPDAVRAYLAHFWSHWSGPGFVPDASELDRLAALYGRPGAFVASINWYRAGSGTVAIAAQERPPDAADRVAPPTTVLWPEHDPLFPREWSDRITGWFADVELRPLEGVGHFTPLEAPTTFAETILERVSTP
jgi:pimeloyl-ACP methyl ester carboxylesterase